MTQRRGYSLILALMSAAILMFVVAAIGRLMLVEFNRERAADLAAHAEQLIAGAQLWSAAHAGELSGAPHELPTSELLPAAIRGTLTLTRDPGEGVGGAHVVCRVSLTRAGRTATWTAHWPLAAGERRATP